MQLNYFGALRLIMGFLPTMVAQKQGHIINISSIGVLSNAPRFSAYVASKSALDAFSACACVRVPRQGHQLHDDQHAAGAHADDRADQDVRERAHAVAGGGGRTSSSRRSCYKPVRIATRLGIFGAVCHAIAPRLTQILLNTAFNMFPDSAAAQGKKGEGAASRSCRRSRWRSRS